MSHTQHPSPEFFGIELHEHLRPQNPLSHENGG